MEANVMEANMIEGVSREAILFFKSFYEERGCKITLCEICHKIKETIHPEGPGISGPSCCSGMFCECKN